MQPRCSLLCARQWSVPWAVAAQPGQDGVSVPRPASAGTAAAAGVGTLPGLFPNGDRGGGRVGGTRRRGERAALQGGPRPRDAAGGDRPRRCVFNGKKKSVRITRRHRYSAIKSQKSKTEEKHPGAGGREGRRRVTALILLPKMNEARRASNHHHRRQKNKILSSFFFPPSLNHLKVLLASEGRN